jgi:hypothetical protein
MIPNLIDSLNFLAFNINNSKYTAGIMMILMNLGGRYISAEISDFQEEFFESPYIRRIFIFVVCFIATRDIKVSFILTLIFVILVSGIFNENSKYCILPVKKGINKITKEEFIYAQSVVGKYHQQQIKKMTHTEYDYDNKSDKSNKSNKSDNN